MAILPLRRVTPPSVTTLSFDTSTTPFLEVVKQPSVCIQHYQVPFHCNSTKDTLTIALDVPEFATDAIKISLEDNGSVLVVHGELKNCIGDLFLIEERFQLNEDTYNVDNIQVLKITVKKKPAPKPRIISISVTNNKKDV
jgi:HSP20 family molecular chaperone IbpA